MNEIKIAKNAPIMHAIDAPLILTALSAYSISAPKWQRDGNQMSITRESELPKIHRRNLSLPRASLAAIDELRGATDAASDAEVIRKALRLYQVLMVQQNDGAEIFVRKDGVDKALMLV